MEKAQINALEIRFKATVLMLLQLDLLQGKIDQLVNYSQQAFDMGNYEVSQKCLDLIDTRIVNLFEV